MSNRLYRPRCGAVAALTAALLAVGASAAAAKPILMPTLQKEVQAQQQIWQQHTFAPKGSLQPPAPPCPENGMLPPPFSSCGVPEAPATTLPYPGNMAYWGGHVQTNPHVYMVYWGWGQKGAFPAGQPCTAEKITEGPTTATLKCDPDGAGKYMANWVYQLGGTQWAGEQTQYYQTVNDPAGNGYSQYITNPANQLGGIWVDDANSITGLPKTSASNPPGATNTYTDLAAEAARAVSHFHITDLANADIVIAQPANYSDPNALSTGYCAFHDYTQPGLEGGIYNGLTKDISYTNMPYSLSINSSGSNVCGENAVNSGPAGKLDGFSIVLGHEIEETVTDPGAEDILGSGTSTTNLGGWYDSLDANENGDKCAWVGEGLGLPGEPAVTPIPGAINNIKGNHGQTFAVQSLWSNQAAEGAGYCAGAGNDLPQPIPPQ
jgi:serine protease